MILVALPSTILHELAHFLTALILGCHPTLPSVIPRPEGRGWRLGSVSARITWLTAFPVALAPLLLLPAAFLIAPHVHLQPVAQAALLPFILRACTPSMPDLKIAFSSFAGNLLWFAASFASLFLILAR